MLLQIEKNCDILNDGDAGVMELADVPDSKSGGLIPRAGSTPAAGTKQNKSEPKADWRRVRICRLFRRSENGLKQNIKILLEVKK